jgi:hypothetical protein
MAKTPKKEGKTKGQKKANPYNTFMTAGQCVNLLKTCFPCCMCRSQILTLFQSRRASQAKERGSQAFSPGGFQVSSNQLGKYEGPFEKVDRRYSKESDLWSYRNAASVLFAAALGRSDLNF